MADVQSALSSTTNDGGWLFLKLAAPVTLPAGKVIIVSCVSSSAAQIQLFRSSTTNDWAKALRTTTTQAPAAGDDLIVAGEHLTNTTFTANFTTGSAVLTSVSSFANVAVGKGIHSATASISLTVVSFDSGAGTITLSSVLGSTQTGVTFFVTPTNDITVTNDQTAATDYGSNSTSNAAPAIAVCKRGTLKFKDTSAANPYLRVSGYLIVYNGGTLNMGTTGTPIPRDSTAVLEFDCAADGDFGLVSRNGSTTNLQGLSRTSGKNVVSAKLTADTAINLVQSVSITALAVNQTAAITTLDPTGTSLAGPSVSAGGFNQLVAVVDTAASSNHRLSWVQAAAVNNITQVYTHWIKRGSGTNNRYVRLQMGDTSAVPTSNGFYADFDLQAGTVGTCTALGTGTATSATITPLNGGFICTIVGKARNASVSPVATIAACNASGGVTYVGDATQNFIISWPQVYTASAQPTDLTIDTDTGWKAGDVIAIASTTRTANECEIVSLASDAGASTLTLNLHPVNFHNGTSTDVQAELINLTRNVKVRSVSNTAMSFVTITDGAAADIDWTEFYYLGENATGKGGVEIANLGSQAFNTDIQFSSIHDCEDFGFRVNGGASATTLVFSNNIAWNLATVLGPACTVNSALAFTNYTIDNNILIRTANNNGWTLSDVGGTFTNNTVVGSAGIGISPQEGSAILGTMTGNVVHSCAGVGVSFSVAGISGTFGGTAWRCNSSGITISNAVIDLILDSVVVFGNSANNIVLSGSGLDVWLKSPISNGDTTFPTTNGIALGVQGSGRVLIDNGDFSTISGIKTAHTNDISISNAGTAYSIVQRSTKMGAATEVLGQANLGNNGFIASAKHDQTAGNHKTWMRNGTIQTDSTVFNTAAPSLLMTPITSGVAFNANFTSGSSDATALAVVANGPLDIGSVVFSATIWNGTAVVTALNKNAGTISFSKPSLVNSTPSQFTLCYKLESAPQFQGVKVALANGGAATVSAYVKKRAENLFTFSEDFSNAAWTATALTATTGQTDPLGGTGATKYLETVANTTHSLSRNTAVTLVNGASYVYSFYIKPEGGRQWFRISEDTRNSWVDLTNGVTGTVSASHSITITSAGGGFYRVSVAFPSSAASWTPVVRSAAADNNAASFVGDVTKGFTIFGQQVEAGSSLSPYQVTTSSQQIGYNGSQPRLIQKANPALGQNSDVVLATAALGNGVWEQISGTTSTATDDGVFEVVVDCDGTTGAINVDDWATS